MSRFIQTYRLARRLGCTTGVFVGLTAMPGSLLSQTVPIPTDWKGGNRNTTTSADGSAKASNAKPAKVQTTLSLQECIAIGQDRQPNIRAALASLASAEAGSRALNNIHPWTTVLAPDLPVRRQQAMLGLAVAQADVQKAQQENIYDITRLYYTYVYARQQEQTATDVILQLEQYLSLARGLVESGAEPDRVTPFTLYTIEAAIAQAQTLRVPAVSGQPLALAALKEAMGVDQNFEFVPRDVELPVMAGEITRDQVIALARSRRPELVQASSGVEAFRLEICAQEKKRFGRTVPTLASGSDLHSRLIPQSHRNGEYRPGALAPEMPVSLAGRKGDRVARATELSVRQDVLMEKTENLVTLEVINAFHNWEATSEKLRIAKERFEKSNKLADLSRNAVAANPKKVDLAIQNEGLIAKWRAEYLEAVYEHIKALASLERVTGGGVKADFPRK